MNEKKRPAHQLRVRTRNGPDRRGVIRAGWWDPRTKRMNIQLNPCVVLTGNDDVFINLFPSTPPPVKPVTDPVFDDADIDVDNFTDDQEFL